MTANGAKSIVAKFKPPKKSDRHEKRIIPEKGMSKKNAALKFDSAE